MLTGTAPSATDPTAINVGSESTGTTAMKRNTISPLAETESPRGKPPAPKAARATEEDPEQIQPGEDKKEEEDVQATKDKRNQALAEQQINRVAREEELPDVRDDEEEQEGEKVVGDPDKDEGEHKN